MGVFALVFRLRIAVIIGIIYMATCTPMCVVCLGGALRAWCPKGHAQHSTQIGHDLAGIHPRLGMI